MLPQHRTRAQRTGRASRAYRLLLHSATAGQGGQLADADESTTKKPAQCDRVQWNVCTKNEWRLPSERTPKYHRLVLKPPARRACVSGRAFNMSHLLPRQLFAEFLEQQRLAERVARVVRVRVQPRSMERRAVLVPVVGPAGVGDGNFLQGKRGTLPGLADPKGPRQSRLKMSSCMTRPFHEDANRAAFRVPLCCASQKGKFVILTRCARSQSRRQPGSSGRCSLALSPSPTCWGLRRTCWKLQ